MKVLVNTHKTPLGIGRFRLAIGESLPQVEFTQAEQEVIELFCRSGYLSEQASDAAPAPVAVPIVEPVVDPEPEVEAVVAEVDKVSESELEVTLEPEEAPAQVEEAPQTQEVAPAPRSRKRRK